MGTPLDHRDQLPVLLTGGYHANSLVSRHMDEHVPDVFVIGAGFSKAVASEMPLLNELSTALMQELPSSVTDTLTPEQRALLPESENTDFERALSFLAVDQPWLTPAENLRNRALFYELSESLAAVIARRQNQALNRAMPDWLAPLLRAWHVRRAVVITFNYDTLIEKAYSAALPEPDSLHYSATYPLAIMQIAALSGAVFHPGGTYNDTFALLKLHGSINWLYSGAHTYLGETLFHVGLDKSWTPDQLTGPDSVHDRRMDKIPLIVPPTASKILYFGNEAVDGLWKLAASKLRQTRRLVIMGYSLPATDTMVQDLLEMNLNPRTRWSDEPLTVDVVNVDHSAAESYGSLIDSVSFTQWSPPSGELDIPAFAREYAGS